MKQILFTLTLLCSMFLKAQNDETKIKRVDSIFTAYTEKKQFNGSVLIARKNKILLSKGYGLANFSQHIALRPQTKFKLASVSKQFTAMGILILQEKGKLSTEDKLSKFIPDYPSGDKITIHHLLTHTSGIPDVTGLPLYDSIVTLPHSIEKMISYTKFPPLEFEPGSKMRYSNSGYILLSYIIEKTSDKKLGEFFKSAIFDPLKMKNTGLWESKQAIANSAIGYNMHENGPVEAGYIDMSIPSGAGAIYSTVEDMFLWDRALYSDELVKKSTVEKMITPFKDNYAYGLRIDNYAGHKMINHGGGIQGFQTISMRFPDEELYIVILKNFENLTLFPAHKICRAIMYDQKFDFPVERKAVEINKSVYAKLIGEYELQPGFSLIITSSEGKIFAQGTNQPKLEIFPESEYKYFTKSVDALIEFTKNDEGNATSLILSQGGAKMPAKKIK